MPTDSKSNRHFQAQSWPEYLGCHAGLEGRFQRGLYVTTDPVSTCRRGALKGLLTGGVGTLLAASSILTSTGRAHGGERVAVAVSAQGKMAKGPIPVAVIVDKGATLVDFAGPWEILSSGIYQGPGFNVYSVAPSREPISCDNGRSTSTERARYRGALSGLTIVPDYTFDDAPQPQVILVGGQSGDSDPRKMEWIRHVYPNLDLAMSVCVGAYVLGNAGLLDGRSATTNANVYDDFQKQFPKVKLVRGVRFVESGNVATATGLTAGIDLALRITDRYFGRVAATKIAKYEEWKSTEWIVGDSG